jgi:cytochrome c-type biogenesis protein CcmH
MKLFYLILLLSIHSVCQAGFESHEFNHPEQEKNYNELIDELRCLVCQNQTIADSNADLAKDLRRQVYEMLQQGKSRQDIVDYMLARYGDFVLYRPPLKSKTILLWVGPVIFLLLGLLLLFVYIRNKKSESSVELNQQQHQKIRQLLEQDEDS